MLDDRDGLPAVCDLEREREATLTVFRSDQVALRLLTLYQ